MKENIKNGLKIVNEIQKLGVACLDMAARMRNLIRSYSDKEIEDLTTLYWEEIASRNYLLEQNTADELIAIVPALKELVEVNQLLELLPKDEENTSPESE